MGRHLGFVKAPPSKSLTQRYLVCAALAGGKSFIKEPLICDDTVRLARALSSFGVRIEEVEEGLFVKGVRSFKRVDLSLHMGDNGTGLRFIMAFSALFPGRVFIDGSTSLRRRPVGPLSDALRSLGVKVTYLEKEGFPPVLVEGPLREGDEVEVDGSLSSQFVSALLLIAPVVGLKVKYRASVSKPYIELTKQAVEVFYDGSSYRPADVKVEGDYTHASYFFEAAGVSKGSVKVGNLSSNSRQADRAFLSILKKMGFVVEVGEDVVYVESPDEIAPIEVSMSQTPDLVPTLAALLAFSQGTSLIKDIEHLRFKESDRIYSVVSALRSIGVRAEYVGGIKIEGGTIRGGVVDPCGDHRIAMAFGVVSAFFKNVRVLDKGCVSKSFPGFWDVLLTISST